MPDTSFVLCVLLDFDFYYDPLCRVYRCCQIVERAGDRAALALGVPLAIIAATMLLFLSKWTRTQYTGTPTGWKFMAVSSEIKAVVFRNVTASGLRSLL